MSKTARHALALALFWTLCLTLALSQSADSTPLVDHRMAPLEQVKKVAAMAPGQGPLYTVMNVRAELPADGDYGHLVLNATPEDLAGQLGLFDGVSWRPGYVTESSACDSKSECQTKTDNMCSNAGHGGVLPKTVQVTVHIDGTKTCSGDCKGGGAVAFVTCGRSAKACFLCD